MLPQPIASNTARIALGVLLALLAASPPIRAKEGIRAGAAKVDITPPLPAAYDLLQQATEVADPLHARVVYLEDHNDQLIIIATDYEGLLRTAYDRLRVAIAQATGVPKNRIVINSSHSHNAPWINLDLEDLLAPHGLRLVDKEYFENVVAKITAGALAAQRGAQPATISAGAANLPELCYNRRNGYVRPEEIERANAKRRYPIGSTDPTLGLVRFNRRDGSALAVLAIYASHYVAVGRDRISASFQGTSMRQIEQALGGEAVALYLQGCAGNMVPPTGLPRGNPEAIEKIGALFSSRALPVLRSGMKSVADGGFSVATRTVELPLAPLREHGSMDYVRAIAKKPAVNASARHQPLTLAQLEQRFDDAVQLFKERIRTGNPPDRYSYILNLAAYGDRLTLARNLKEWSRYDFVVLGAGPLRLVFLPGESFIEFALEIRERAGAEFTFVAAYNDLTPVYIPDRMAFEEGGYETGLWCYSTPETGEVIVREALRLVGELR